MSPETFIRAQIAAFAHAEGSATGGFQGMLALACVIRNRQRAGWFSGDWMFILNNVSDSAPYEWLPVPPRIDLKCPLFRRVLQEVDDIHSGLFEDDMTCDALYYLDTNTGRTIRPWFQDRIVRDFDNHPRVAQVGTIYFFR